MIPGLNRLRQLGLEKAPTDADGAGLVALDVERLIGLRQGATGLNLGARKVRALHAGGHLSPFKGRGMEFDEARPYQPGDDIRAMDWRVTARTGKPHTKLFREERERSVLICTDLRPTMLFASRGRFKSVVASEAAALIAWASEAHGDRVGGLIFSEQDELELRPRRGRRAVLHYLHSLAQQGAWDPARLADHGDPAQLGVNLARLRRVARPGSLIFILSDFRGLDEACETQLALLARHSDLVLGFVHDPLEGHLPPPGRYRLTDGERALAIDTADGQWRRDYQARFAHHRQRLAQLCLRRRLYLFDLATDADVPATVREALEGRR